ncbi:MAG TPA: Clp protease [Alphaproteobacteria bacterium]|nr:Clp protease [Alphaproteobacteria bacterium]
MLSFKNKWLTGGVWGALSLAYPFLVYFFFDVLPASYLIGGIISFLLLRAILPLFGKEKTLNSSQKSSLFLAIFVSLFMGSLYLWKSQMAPLLYPVVMSLTIATLFGSTLLNPPSMIERLARLTEPNLGAAAVVYTRKVTLVWVIFCLINASVSFITVVLNDLRFWTLYNGCISYVLMGLLMLLEYGFRLYHKARN